MQIEAKCFWGEGPDVSIILRGQDAPPDGLLFILEENLRTERTDTQFGQFEHGFACKGYIDLTISQAESLAQQLLSAVQAARQYEEDWINSSVQNNRTSKQEQ
jgi:hypothetical protein